MPSFDIVSEIDTVELRNAVDNASRELSTRFDFRGVEASFEMQKDESVRLNAEGDFQLKQMRDILRSQLTKRGVDVKLMVDNVDLTTKEGFNWLRDNLLDDSVEFLQANKTYSEDKNLDKFKLIQQGGVITKGDLFKYFDKLVNQ